MTAAEIKAQWRREMRARLRQVPPAERQAASETVAHWVMGQPVWRKAEVVLLYAALPDELDLSLLLTSALEQGKRVALPAYEASLEAYRLREVREPARDLTVGRFGILEPRPETQEISLKLLDLAVVPGLGFNQAGVRLGRGQGYYDRLLGGRTGCKWGVGYSWQVGLDFPGEPQDVTMTALVTPSGLQECAAAVET